MKDDKAIQNANGMEIKKGGSAIVHHEMSFSSPFPPPAILKQYEELYPGAMKRIMDIAERQQNADIELRMADSKRQDALVISAGMDVTNEERLIRINGKNIALAIVMAFLLGVSSIAGACVCAKYNHPWLGGCIGCGGIASIVTAFIYGAHMKREEVANESGKNK